jgi:hypothetical protein
MSLFTGTSFFTVETKTYGMMKKVRICEKWG